MILREIKNIYIKNRLTEGVDFKRYDWLKGDGSAYIDTKITYIGQSEIKVKFKDTDEVTNGSRVFGSEIANIHLRLAITKVSGNWNIYDAHAGRKMADSIGIIELIFNPSSQTVIVNGNTQQYYPPAITLKDSILVFTQYRRETNTSQVFVEGTSKLSISYFEIHNQINLVPCQLLKSIPATLDANNIARSAGECGMYDSITGKFYGNVASSGTFTVEGDVEPENHSGLQQIYQNRLIEGVDYQTADWLKGEGIINYDKPIDYLSDNLRIKIRNLDSNSGYNTIWVGGETNSDNNDWSRCIIDFEVVNGVAGRQVQWCEYVYRNGYYRYFPASSDNIYTFDININRAIINGVTYSMTSSRCNVTTPFVITLREADSIAYCKLNNVDMYPCKLLKPIPRNLDANNIARAAGECGMYDSISGKFYGNVAGSGTFTVENDNE